MGSKNAITVTGVSKAFKLPHEKSTSIKSAFINFRKTKKGFERQQVLDNISFEVKQGEFFGITGRNGSGKSTLLKLLAGIYTQDSGSIDVQGKLTPFIELGVGFNPELSGRENVFLNGALLGFNRKEMLAMYDDIVSFAELEQFMDQKLKNYSSGMQVRLAFSIAIRAQSDILLIDEVLAVGDANFQNKCIAVFEEIKKRGTTVVFVSHDMEAVRRFCDRVILMQDGVISKEGGAQEVIDEYMELNARAATDDGSPFGVDSATTKSGVVEIQDVKVVGAGSKHTEIINEDTYHIDLKVKFLADCKQYVPGVVLRNQAGLRVMASNTHWADFTVPPAKKDDILTFRFTFDNALEHGSYFVSANVVADDMQLFYHWSNDAVSFKVNSKPPTGGIVNPRYKVEVV